MPFSSMSQRRKFYALKNEGKMTQDKIDEWESETPKNIPEKVMKTASAFWNGFEKQAATRAFKEQVAALGKKLGIKGLTPKRVGREAPVMGVGGKPSGIRVHIPDVPKHAIGDVNKLTGKERLRREAMRATPKKTTIQIHKEQKSLDDARKLSKDEGYW